MQIDLGRFRAAFFVEAAEHLQQMESALLELEGTPGDSELLNTIFRAAHSIKGASTTFGVDEIGRFTHVLENLLERLRNREFQATGELIEVLLSSIDVIEGLIVHARDGGPIPPQAEHIYAELTRFAAATNDASTPSPSTEPADHGVNRLVHVAFRPSRRCFEFGTDPLLIVRDLLALGEHCQVEADFSALPDLAIMDPEYCYAAWSITMKTTATDQEIRDVAMFLDEESCFAVTLAKSDSTEIASPDQCPSAGLSIPPDASIAPAAQVSTKSLSGSTTAESETIRVDRNRLDMLINQIGELVIGASMVEQDVLQLSNATPPESLSSLGKIVRDLQEMSLSLRMVPVAAAFQKMHRVVRDLSKKLDKEVEFLTEGDETELDKTVVDQIGDPLLHMVRNAIDHGIESSAERLAAGKSPVGRIELRAYQQGGNIYLELEDDGRGLNREKILRKAIERGLIDSEANLSDAEVYHLIFQPGFSTADEITDVSGRGVGMDVVRRNVEALQGSVSIRSTAGRGSIITVRLPLTLAILDGLLVRLTNDVFVVPLLSVVESIVVKPAAIQRIMQLGEVMQLRGETVPLIRLHRTLNIEQAPSVTDNTLVVIVEDQQRHFALCVDELLGQQQVVIKNLETNFCKVPGVAGATILGDGRVALILDLVSLTGFAHPEVT